MREYSNVNIVDIGSDARIELRYDDAMAEHSVRCEIIGTGGMDRCPSFKDGILSFGCNDEHHHGWDAPHVHFPVNRFPSNLTNGVTCKTQGTGNIAVINDGSIASAASCDGGINAIIITAKSFDHAIFHSTDLNLLVGGAKLQSLRMEATNGNISGTINAREILAGITNCMIDIMPVGRITTLYLKATSGKIKSDFTKTVGFDYVRIGMTDGDVLLRNVPDNDKRSFHGDVKVGLTHGNISVITKTGSCGHVSMRTHHGEMHDGTRKSAASNLDVVCTSTDGRISIR